VPVYALRPEGIAGSQTLSESSTTSSPPPVAAPRLSIVVLPFTNLSDDREQQYFADGVTEDLTMVRPLMRQWTRVRLRVASSWRDFLPTRARSDLEAGVTSRGRPIKFIPKLTELACAELTQRDEIANPRRAFRSGARGV
jgi:hypothetical protein